MHTSSEAIVAAEEKPKRRRLTEEDRAEREKQKEELKETVLNLMKPIWDTCGQPENFSYGLSFVLKVYPKYDLPLFLEKIIPWCREYMRQYELSKKQYRGKLVPTLPNLYTFIQRERWNDNLPYSFVDLRERNGSSGESTCQCGKPATQHTGQCAWCYTKEHSGQSPTSVEKVRNRWSSFGIRKVNGEGWRDHCINYMKRTNLISSLPESVIRQNDLEAAIEREAIQGEGL